MRILGVRQEEPWPGNQETWAIFAPSVRRGHDLWTVVSLSVTWHREASLFLATVALLRSVQGAMSCGVWANERGTPQPILLDVKALKDWDSRPADDLLFLSGEDGMGRLRKEQA